MPYYKYECPECNKIVDLQRAIDDRDEPVACDSCGIEMPRKWTAPSVQFKGSGFYRTGG